MDHLWTPSGGLFSGDFWTPAVSKWSRRGAPAGPKAGVASRGSQPVDRVKAEPGQDVGYVSIGIPNCTAIGVQMSASRDSVSMETMSA